MVRRSALRAAAMCLSGRSHRRRDLALDAGRRAVQTWRVVLEEDARDKFAAGAYARLFENGFQVILNGPWREDEALRDCACVEALRDQLGHSSFALG